MNITGAKTYLVALIPIFVGVLEVTDWNAFIANPMAGIIALGSGFAMAVMRYITQKTTVEPLK
jgi:hypothetical protein